MPIVQGAGKGGNEMSKKDACYHKVKARYRVFPSAYASGAIAKCRKVGAKNWGNKAKIRQLEKQMEEWCAELQSSETDRSTDIKPPRSTDASSKKN